MIEGLPLLMTQKKMMGMLERKEKIMGLATLSTLSLIRVMKLSNNGLKNWLLMWVTKYFTLCLFAVKK